MAKMNSKPNYVPRSPQGIVSTTDEQTVTYEGGQAFKRDAKSELFMLGVSYMAGEPTFYESADEREVRFRDLIHRVTADDPQWVVNFITWLRGPEANIRTASLMGAVEYARAGGPKPRGLIKDVCQRADEPGEMIAYIRSRHGKKLAGGVQRGIADAAVKLYNEYSAQKYDGAGSSSFRMGDVIELTHPVAYDPISGTVKTELFKYLLDRRHHSTDIRADLTKLPMIAKARHLETIQPVARREYLRANPGVLKEAGKTWEWLGGWIPDGMDAEAWSAILGPDAQGMPFMAMLRNLRNFENAGVDKKILAACMDRISDPDEVARSRQFPFRFYSAFQNTSINFGPALERALDLSTQNIPDLDGTLIVIDVSGSMTSGGMTAKSNIRPVDVAALAAMAVYKRSENCDVAIFGQTWARVNGLTRQTGVLRGIEKIDRLVGSVGYYSNGHGPIHEYFDPRKHKRAFIFTDGALSDSGSYNLSNVPSIYTFNVGGYGATHTEMGKNGRHEIGGFTDSTFKMIRAIEAGRDSVWPWEA